jgi:CBS domain containing-hemolysin-like protein
MEIAFVTSNRLKIELDKKHGIFSSKIISVFTSNPAFFIATMLVGNNIALVIYGIIMAELLEPVFYYNFSIHSEVMLLVIKTIIGTSIILFTGEFLPKTIFRIRPNTTLKIFAFPTLILYILLYPITFVTIRITNIILRYAFGYKRGIKKEIQEPVFGKVDLDHLVNENQNLIEINDEDEPEMKIFQNVLLFSHLKVRDCMVPRTEITAVEFKTPVTELIQKFIETGYSKILVYLDSIDNIIGYVGSKELYKGSDTLKSRLVTLSIVPESMQVNKLFRNLIREHKSMALVVDEYGGTSGIITLEDIMEEIFGEIEDEHDTTEFVEKQVNENEFIFSGRLEIDYLNEKYKLNFLESEDYDTLAGLIIFHQGNIPEINSTVIIGKYKMQILKVSQTRIELVHVIIHPS